MINVTMKCVKYILCISGSLVLASIAHAASFDCSKASTKVEHLICDNLEISKLDDELAADYKVALINLGDKTQEEKVKQAQKLWLRERNNCRIAACLMTSYQARIQELTAKKDTRPRSKSGTDEYVLVEQEPEQTGEYLSHIEPDPAVCKLYEENLNYFAHQNVPMSCNRPIAPQFKDRIKEVEWEDLKPADYPELFRQVVLFMSRGHDKTSEALKKREAQLATREYVFRRAKIELSGELSWHGSVFGITPPQQEYSKYSGRFNIVQYGRNNTNTQRPSEPCKPVRGSISLYGNNLTWFSYSYELGMFAVNAEMNAMISTLGTLSRGEIGEHMRLIDGKLYAEKNDFDASIYLLRVNLESPVFLESLCKYQFNPAQVRK